MVLLHTRFGTLAATAFAVLLALQMHGTVPPAQVMAWLAVKLVVAAARIALAQAYSRWGERSAQHERWERAMLVLLALDGLVWGVAGWRMASEAVPVASLAAAALAGVSCVATFGLQVRLAATAAYVAPMLVPLAWGLASRGDGIANFAAAGLLLLLALQLATARASSQRLTTGLLLRTQADRLVAEKDAALQLAHERSAERDRFLAKVSHELRTPLHGILGLARLMRLDTADPVASRRLELIEASGSHLQGLINDLLEASVINAGCPRCSRCGPPIVAWTSPCSSSCRVRAGCMATPGDCARCCTTCWAMRSSSPRGAASRCVPRARRSGSG
jgi:signal transduction histidine kinase